MSLRDKRGWFADSDDRVMWTPYFQYGVVGVIPLDISFPSKEQCEEFIREEIIGAGMYDDEA